MALIKQVILKRMSLPAKNKWTKMDPAFDQAVLILSFFSLVKDALELKVRTTYEALAASGQDFAKNPDDDNDEEGETMKGALMRFGKRSLVVGVRW